MNEDTLLMFDEWVRRQREALGLAQAELAQMVNYSVDMIRKIERGERRPGRDLAQRLGTAFQLNAREQARFVKVAVGDLGVEHLPPLHAADQNTSITYLPVQVTPLVGRVDELAHIAGYLKRPNARLITLIGPGGIGKTRLALKSAEEHLLAFAGEVYFVSLAALQSPDFLVSAIANVLRISLHGQADPKVRLLNELRQRKLLLVLDNYEHFLPEIQLLTDLLQAAPQVQILVTSRERLNIQEEWSIIVKGLSFPDNEEFSESENFSALQLFVESAHRVQADFIPCSEDWTHIVHICRLVEGMPLAIELAAAWVRVMSCAEIAEEIAGGMTVLETSLRNVPERHRSMRAVFDHSWKRLTPEEQQVLQQIAIFRGGFSRAAAEQVTGASLILLTSLLDKSLLQRSGQRRYDMHELVRQYVEAHLQSHRNEFQAVQERHCMYFTGMLQQHTKDLRSQGLLSAMDSMRIEIENFRLAWQCAASMRHIDALQQSLQSLLDFYDIQGWFQEGEETFQFAVTHIIHQGQLLEDLEHNHGIVLGQLLAAQGWLCMTVGHYEQARIVLNRSLQVFDHFQEYEERRKPIQTLGIVAYIAGDYSQAAQLLQESFAIDQSTGDQWSAGWSIGMHGLVSLAQGLFPEAHAMISEALERFTQLNDQRMIALSLSFLSAVTCVLGDVSKGLLLAQQSLSLSQELSHPWGITSSLCHLGIAMTLAGNYTTALQLYQESLDQIRKTEDPWFTARVLVHFADTMLLVHSIEQAEKFACEALLIARKSHLYPQMLDALRVIATIRIGQQQIETAIQIINCVRGHPASSFLTHIHLTQLMHQLETQLSSAHTSFNSSQSEHNLDHIMTMVLN